MTGTHTHLPTNLLDEAISQNLLTERWKSILECKKAFLENGNIDFKKFPFMKPEVIDSWMRSRDLRINPYSVEQKSKFQEKYIKKILNDNQELIEITKKAVAPCAKMFSSCGHIFYLLNKQGFILWDEGNRDTMPELRNCKTRLGILSNENSAGTTAHELCIQLKKPVQLLGPEHYCVVFQDSIASAIPLKDERNNIIGAVLLLSQPLKGTLNERMLKDICRYSLTLITSIAASIEMHYRLSHNLSTPPSNQPTPASKNSSEYVYSLQLLDNTLDFIDDGILIIDRSGKVIHANKKSIDLLKLPPTNDASTSGINICDYFNKDFNLAELISQSEQKLSINNSVVMKFNRKNYQAMIKPLFNKKFNKVEALAVKINAKNATGINNINSAQHTFDHIIGKSKAIHKSIQLAKRFAKTTENILLIGESGTGKEVFAQSIHNEYRSDGPFVAVNCAALPKDLIESELFGYESGSFTGADRSGRIGKIELANGGTLFLDEIGDMPLNVQAVLLRTIEDKKVMRIGGQHHKDVSFKLIAATNKNLYEMVQENKFREDLFFRLSVLTLNIPPLRDRGEDIELLSQHFINNYCRKQGWSIPKLNPEAQKIINTYGWHGNVRQLQNAIIYAINTAQTDEIAVDNLPDYILKESRATSPADDSGTDQLYLKNLERAAIETALQRANSQISDVAKLLGISRSTLYRKLKEYNISI